MAVESRGGWSPVWEGGRRACLDMRVPRDCGVAVSRALGLATFRCEVGVSA